MTISAWGGIAQRHNRCLPNPGSCRIRPSANSPEELSRGPPGCPFRETLGPGPQLAPGLWLSWASTLTHNVPLKLPSCSQRPGLWSHFTDGKTEAVRQEETHLGFLSGPTRLLQEPGCPFST